MQKEVLVSRSRKILSVALALVLVVWASVAVAKVAPRNDVKGPVKSVQVRPDLAFNIHDVGNLVNAVRNDGVYGDPNALFPSAEWPAGSGVNYIWEGRFWFGALVGGEALVSHADYGNYEYRPTDNTSYYFGFGPKAIQDGWVQFDDLDGTIGGHNPIGLMVSQRSLAWSLPDYDDFQVYLIEITNASGGILSGAFLTMVYDNDVAVGNGIPTGTHLDDLVDYDGWTPGGANNAYQNDWVDPLDIDGDGDDGYDYWGWERANPKNPYFINDGQYAGKEPTYSDDFAPDNSAAEPDGFWDEYQIYLADYAPVIRYQADFTNDLGSHSAGDPAVTADGDTLRGYLISRNASLMYDGDYFATPANDTGERTVNPNGAGFIGTRFLYIPREPFFTTAADSFPRPFAHQWWNIDTDPADDTEKYQYMEARHPSAFEVPFRAHPYDDGGGAPSFDYRYLQSIGPFNNWGDGETKKFVKVTALGRGIKGLRENLDNAMVAYYTGNVNEIGDPYLTIPGSATAANYGNQRGFTGAGAAQIELDKHFLLPVPPPIPQLNYSARDGAVSLVWDNVAELTVDRALGTVDFEGYKVYRSLYNTTNWEMIAAFDEVNGPVWLTSTEGDTINPISYNGQNYTMYHPQYATIKAENTQGTEWTYVQVDLPSIQYQYLDDGGDFMDASGTTAIFAGIDAPVNGLGYFYSVVAYDPDKPARNLFSAESARSNYRTTQGGAPDPVLPRSASAGPGNVDNVKVVPNPYKGTALFEAQYEDQISFINLPDRCKISVFTLTGDLVQEFYKNDGVEGSVSWDLLSRNEQKIVSGLYIYVVETPEGEKKVGKFLVLRGQ